MSKIIPLPPFKAFLASNIPSVYDNTLSYYDELTKLIAYMEELVPAVNANTEGLAELKKYVENYFDNLDVQEEINNKLDDMAESGQLATIIAEFLAMAPVFGFTNIAAMAASENLNVGSIARVLGNTSAAAGDGAFYLVRSKGEGESADGVQKVAIGDTLIADRIINATANDLQDQIDELREPTKKYLFVGDSYADGYTPDGNVTPWQSIVKDKLGLSDSQYNTVHQGGFGFARPAQYNYYTLINALSNDEDLTDIVIGGGYNDQGYGYADVNTGINNVVTLCASKFPNAKVHIAFIGWSKNAQAKSSLIYTYHYYNVACNNNPSVDFMMNTQYALHDYFNQFSSDGIHPNLAGQNAIANAVYDALVYGSANISYAQSFYFTGPGISGGSINTFMHNEVTSLWSENVIQLTYAEGSYPEFGGVNPTELATITGGCMVGTTGVGISITVPCVIDIDTDESTAPHAGRYVTVPMQIQIQGGKIYGTMKLINSAGGNYGKYVVKAIQLPGLSVSVNSMLA